MAASPRTRVALVFGGRSSEHAISCVSAGSVLAVLDSDRYEVVAIGITPEGRWVLGPADPAQLAISGRELPQVKDGQAVALPGDPTVGGLLVLEPAQGTGLLSGVDVVFPLLHGPYGEDGTIQGLLEMAGVPYVGSGVLASAVAMDKEYMKLVLQSRGVPATPWTGVTALEWRTDPDAVRARVEPLGLPLFVKPARAGSSIGISRVRSLDDLGAALALAHEHDPKALVESEVRGREIECGVLGGLDGAAPEASLPAEIRVTGGQEFYDFEAKYLEDATEFDVPAELPADVTEQVRATAVHAFDALGCAGLARVDFFLQDDGELLVNEVNTMPGFTPSSMFPRMWAATGLDYPRLVERLLTLALQRGTGLR